MEIKKIDEEFSVCQVETYTYANLDSDYCFLGKTDEEKSLVCPVSEVPANVIKRDDGSFIDAVCIDNNGWMAFRIQGVLDFSLIGILAKIASVLADNGISIFAVSTYNTDYVMVKKENFQDALEVLAAAGYEIVD